MEVIKQIVIRIVVSSVLLTLADMLLPEGKVRAVAKFLCTLIVASSVALSVINAGEMTLSVADGSKYEQTQYSASALCKRNAEETVRRMLAKVQGFEESEVLIRTEESDYICRVSGIVIYCSTPDADKDEEVAALLCKMYKLDKENVVITR